MWKALILTLSLASQATSPDARPTSSHDAQQASVLAADTAFWDGFNHCDPAVMGRYFTEDVEFFHDQTGLTKSRAAVVRSLLQGPCGTPGLHIRRQAVADGRRFSVVPAFGAVLAGDHVFYARQGDGPEVPATLARFTTVWKLEPTGWKMARVVSYDHRPAPYTPPVARLKLAPAELATFVGRYQSDAGPINVRVSGEVLEVVSGNLRVTLVATEANRFSAAERNLQFVFSSDRRTVAVEENGKVAATGVRSPG
jgi:ketosteroid isomerase-like protein